MSSHAEQGNMSKSMSDPFESPLFRRLLEAVEKQVHHTETLQKEALKDERAYALGKWGDEPAWKAMYKMATAITKEMTDEWKDGMDATLIFVRIFLNKPTMSRGYSLTNLLISFRLLSF
ncbi:hypothetical protein SISNIDRAFT_451370 [Sistotremastrum niveocremeum HHB9708]|uniref:DUF6535 domain-containing protein n=2 Tax=Sistotremastraceae TaxID=3402574 RepID=A0A164X9K0_9AGAM|nr:hypothetical protein SISNIDRAFT_451370 [Sistotremastrum niveocremeum HHB9708]KZT32791.1 hypothetical protein SISSUDRAFT_1055072 [Sistotremastrum suecicum HHB10207 ss-3]